MRGSPVLLLLVVLLQLLTSALVTSAAPSPTSTSPSSLSSSKPVAAEVMGTFQQVAAECRRQTGATEADFEALAKKERVASMEAKCMRACLMKRFGLMDADGRFNKDVVLKIAGQYARSPEKLQAAREIAEACHQMEVSANHCEAAEQYARCSKDQASARGLQGPRHFGGP